MKQIHRMPNIIGLSYGDPKDPNTWSNNPLFLFGKLKELGYLDIAWGEIPNKFIKKYGKIYTAIKFLTIKPNEITHLSYRYFLNRRLNHKFLRFLSRFEDKDNAIVLSTSSFISFDDINLPIYLYGDQSFYQYYHFYPGVKKRFCYHFAQKICDYEVRQAEKCAAIFCFSNWMKNSLIEDYKIDRDKIFVVGHGYCLPKIDDFQKKDFEEPILLFVSTNWKNKGGDIVLKAFRILKDKFRDLKLHIVGRIPEFLRNSLNNNIIFHGFLNKNNSSDLQKLIDLYKKAAVFILPSIYDPMPNITLEANYLQTPVITSNVCGIPEQVLDGETGYIISDNRPESYADRIAKLLEDTELRYKMGINGRKFVMERFSWDSTVKKMINAIVNNLS